MPDKTNNERYFHLGYQRNYKNLILVTTINIFIKAE